MAQWRVTWLIEHSTSHQLLWCIDSFVLRNPPLRQAPNRDQFITGTNIIEKTPLPDLMFFIENDVEELELDNGGSEFVSYGLMEIRVTKPNIKVGDEKYYGDKYIPSDNEILADRLEITDFEIVASISWIGQILRENLCKE